MGNAAQDNVENAHEIAPSGLNKNYTIYIMLKGD